MSEIAAKAQRMQMTRLVAFLAAALAIGGGKVKLDEMSNSVKRFERNRVPTNSAKIVDSGTGKDITLTYTNKEDRAVLVTGFSFNLDGNAASIPDGVIDQLNRVAVVEIKRQSGSNHEVSFAAHSTGVNPAAQAGFTDDKRYATASTIMQILTDEDIPVDYLNPGESISWKITGMNAVTALDSYGGDVNIMAHLATYDAVKG